MSNSNDTIVADTDVRAVDGGTELVEAQPVTNEVPFDPPYTSYPEPYPYAIQTAPPRGFDLFLSRLRWGYYPRQLKYWLQDRWFEFKSKLPKVVFYGDEIDVLVTFTGEKYPQLALPTNTGELSTYLEAANEAHVRVQHAPDAVANATSALLDAGIGFDYFADERGRHWVLDYSLTGPMRVKFLGKTKNPLARKE